MRTTSLIVITCLVACTDDSKPADTLETVDTSETGDTSETSDTSETGEDPEVIVPDPVALLDRAATETYTCAVDRVITQVPDASYQIETLLWTPAGAVVTRAFPKIEVARVGGDGTMSAPTELDPSEYSASQSTTALHDGSVGVVWYRQDETGTTGELMFARVKASDLSVEVAPKSLAISGASYSTQPTLVARAGGFGLMYARPLADGLALEFVSLTLDGVVEGTATQIAYNTVVFGFSQSIVFTGNGYAAMWTRGGYDSGEVFFAQLDVAGAVVLGPLRISQPAGDGLSSGGNFFAANNQLLVRGTKAYAVFTETRTAGSFDAQESSTIARLAVIEGYDVKLYALQAAVEDMTAVMPSLQLIDGKLGLLWSYGEIIYICAGCITDYDLHLVLLDPDTLDPISNEVLQVETGHGFTRPRGVVVDGKLLTTTQLDFHALSYPATGTFACTPSP